MTSAYPDSSGCDHKQFPLTTDHHSQELSLMKVHELYSKMAILCGEVLNINSYTGVFLLGLKVKKGQADFSVLSRIAGRLQAESTTCLNLTPKQKHVYLATHRNHLPTNFMNSKLA